MGLIQDFKNESFNMESYLEKRGVKNVYAFLKGDESYMDKPSKYDNMEDGYNLLMKHINNDKYIYILQDCDVDGITSTAVAYKYLKHLNKDNIKIILHQDKLHGINEDILSQIDNDCGLLWIPDAGSSDFEYHEKLYNDGIDILCTDHHNTDKEKTDKSSAVIINNQISNVTNKFLCGCGVTYKFVQYCCDKTNDKFYTLLDDLVAMGTISDTMDMKYIENRIFVNKGLTNLHNPFMKELCCAFIRDGKINPTSIGWSVVPKLNSVQRSDDCELKMAVIEAFCEIREDYEDIIERCKTQHKKQKTESEKLFKRILEEYKANEKDNVYIIPCENSLYAGLVANKLASEYNRPVFLVSEKKGDKYIGSCRSPIDLLEQTSNSNITFLSEGHERAFGVGWDICDTNALKQYLNALEFNFEAQDTVKIAKSYDCRMIPDYLFGLVDNYKMIFGSGLPLPLFNIRNIRISSKDIEIIGNQKTVLKFRHLGITYLKFFCTHKYIESLKLDEKRDLNLSLLTSNISINEYKGYKNKQIIIDKISEIGLTK